MRRLSILPLPARTCSTAAAALRTLPSAALAASAAIGGSRRLERQHAHAAVHHRRGQQISGDRPTASRAHTQPSSAKRAAASAAPGVSQDGTCSDLQVRVKIMGLIIIRSG
jgi:hypothetical protein